MASTEQQQPQEGKPPFPPFTEETARIKVKMAQNAWNTKDPHKVKLAYTPDSIWRNRSAFLQGRDAIAAFLADKWAREHHYRLRKELFAFRENRIAVQFWYEWCDAKEGAGEGTVGGSGKKGQWYRTYGLEDWTFSADGLMEKRMMSANDVKIGDGERWFREGVDVDSVEIGDQHW